MRLDEKMISSEEIFNGVAIHLVKDEILLPNGNKGIREVVRHPGAVCVIPVTDEGEVIFVNQFRYAIGRVTIEVPAGKLEKGEDPTEAALRELSEETGITAGKIESLGAIYTSPAIIDEIIYMYIATDLKQGEQHLDEDEFVNVVKMPLSEAVDMVMHGKIMDAKTEAIVLKAEKYLNK